MREACGKERKIGEKLGPASAAGFWERRTKAGGRLFGWR